MSSESGPPAEQTASTLSSRPSEEPPGRRRGLSPIARFLLFLVTILIAIPSVLWLVDSSGDGSDKRPVLVVGRTVSAFSLLTPGDLHVELREAADDPLVAEVPLGTTVALKELAAGAMVARTDVAVVASSVSLPRDPVVIRAAVPATLPEAATVGGRVTIYGLLGKQRFTVGAVLLNREKGAVFLVSRDDARNFGSVIASGKVVTIVEVGPR